MAAISLQNVHKSYGRSEVIHGVSCDISDGEFVVVVGPSGCGKSTLLRMVAGLETVTSGDVLIGGERVNEREPAERDIAMVFQNYALYPHMSVYNNMAYGLKNRGISKDDIESKVRRAAEILELEQLLKRRPRELSGGQRQRVAMGRAIVRNPKAFLFDEPLSNLDAKLRVQMRIEIKRLHEELGVTSVYVTHDQVEAMTLGQRLLVMNGGHVEQIGAPLELYETPRTAFVAGFIGSPSMNLLPGRVDDSGSAVVLDDSAGARLSVAGGSGALRPGSELTVGVRPEHLQIGNDDAAPGGALILRAEMVEALGADTLIHGRLGDAKTVLSVRADGALRPKTGDTLRLGVAPQHVHLFDAGSGARVA